MTNNKPYDEKTEEEIKAEVLELYPEALYKILKRLEWEYMDDESRDLLLSAYSVFIHDQYITKDIRPPEDTDKLVEAAFAWGEDGETEEDEIQLIEETDRIKRELEGDDLIWAVELLSKISSDRTTDALYLDHRYIYHLAFEKNMPVPDNVEELARGYEKWLKGGLR